MTEIHLSPRETAVLQGLAAGETLDYIACKLGISRRTAKNYSDSVRVKLGVQTNAAAVARAIGCGLIFVFILEDKVTITSTS